MMKKWMGEVCLYLISLSYLFTLNSLTGVPRKEAISMRCDSLLLHPEIESLTAAIIVNEEVYKFHKGHLLTGELPTDESLYEVASLTKTFTGTLLAKAMVDGKIALEDDIRDFLPGEFPNLAYENHPIRVRHVLTHESRLPRMFPNKVGLFDNPDFDTLPYEIIELQKNFSKTQFFQALKKVQLDTIPGHNFSYSNAGANLLGYVLEEIYQTPYEELLNAHILQPLGMEHTEIRRAKVNKRLLVQGQNHKQIKMPFNPQKYMNAAGGIMSSVDDMICYMNFHLKAENPVVATAHQALWDGKHGEYETSFFWQIIKEEKKPEVLFQNGGALGTSSWITLIPEQKIGIFLVTNTSGPDIHRKLRETVDSIVEVLEK